MMNVLQIFIVLLTFTYNTIEKFVVVTAYVLRLIHIMLVNNNHA